MLHYRPGSNKLSIEKSYARLTDREKSVLTVDRAMYPPLLSDRVARKAIQREIEREEGDRVVEVGILRRAVVGIVVVLLCQEYNNKRGLIRVV